MARTKKVDFKNLSILELKKELTETVEKLKAILEAVDSVNEVKNEALPILSKLGVYSYNIFPVSSANSSTPYFGDYTRRESSTSQNYLSQPTSQVKNYPRSQNNEDLEELDLIVAPLDPTAPEGVTVNGSLVADYAVPGIPVEPVSDLNNVEKQIKNRISALEASNLDKDELEF